MPPFLTISLALSISFSLFLSLYMFFPPFLVWSQSVNPGALVLSASVLPRASSGGMSKASKYLSAIQAAGWNVDLFNTHIYPMNGEGTDVWYSMLEDCKSTLASMGAPTTEVWVTETDYNLLGDVIPEDQVGVVPV